MRFLRAWARRRWFRRMAALFLCAAAAVAMVRASETAWAARLAHTATDRALALSARAGFEVRDVTARGNRRTTLEDVRKAVGAVRGAPALGVDLRAVRARIEALPWVREAKVERALPDKLVVVLIERETLAIWDRGQDFTVVDTTGHAIPGVDPRAYPSLPVIRGDGAAAPAPAMLAILRQEADLASRITGLSYVSGRRWNVYLDWQIAIKLPEEGAEAAWARLAQIDRERQLLDGDIAHIDMRFDGRMVVRMAQKNTAERS